MRCNICGFDSPPGLRFCGNCGAALESPPALAEERRLVTVLFADVAGSTALGETLDPEDLRALYARYYAIAREVVDTHGGTLAKFIGDAVMAVFGLPQAHGDDAQRALSAALELRDRVRADPKLCDRLPIRLGVNTGEVIATREGSAGEFLITGDTVNVAARLEQAAEPWTALCSMRTARAAGGTFVFGPPVDIAAKGKSVPVGAVALLERATPAVAHRAPLVGRGPDLAQLELVAGRAFQERRPFLVSLIAPAGTGKTRLLEEFADRLPALAPEATLAVAQCLPYGQRLTYWPLRAVLFRLVGVPEDSDPELARAAIRAWLERCGVELPERVAEQLAATIGVGEVEVADRAALFSAWRTAFEAAARRTPLVLAFEDLHWSSDSLLDLVEFVMQPRADAPLLMIVLTRPELLDRRPAWGGGRRNYVSLGLEPLGDDAVAELVQHLLGAPSREIVNRVVARAEGNPFYAGEIVRSVAERVPSLEDEEAVSHALATLPDTVQATVLARLDLLETHERRVLQLGSVFGRAFRPAGIAAVASDLTAEAERIAERLADKDLIRPSDGDGFAFRHILIREVAYQTLPRSERARLHLAAGRWLEEGAAGKEEALAELIAYHYREAATLPSVLNEEDAGAGAVRRSAVHWLSRAAEVATAGAAMGEAARHLRGAIELAEPRELPELYERLGVASGGNASVEAHRTSLRLHREAGSPPDEELRVLARLLIIYTRFQGAISPRLSADELARWRAEGHTLAARASDERAIAMFHIGEAFVPFWLEGGGTHAAASDLAEAEASARRGLALVERLDDAGLQSAALDALGSVAQGRGSWKETREFARQRLGFQERIGLTERVDAHSMATWSSILLGELGEADRVSAAGVALVQPGQAIGLTLHLMAWRTYALTLLGRWDEAAAAGERARQLWIESGIPSAGYSVRGFIAALDVARGCRDARLAEQTREVLDELFRASPDSPHRAMRPYLTLDLDALEALVLRKFRLAHVGNIERSERALALCTDHGRPPAPEVVRPIVEFAESHGYPILEAQARRALGVALRDPKELARALAIFERCGARPYAARVRCERGLLTGDETEVGAGMHALEEIGDVDQLGRVGHARGGAHAAT